MPAGQMLLKKVIIRCDSSSISKSSIYTYVKQKPNRKLFGLNIPHLVRRGTIGKKNLYVDGAGYPFYLHIHNLVNPVREKKRKARRDDRYERRKVRRANKGRKEPRRRRTVGEFLLDIGEPPVVYDSSKTRRSASQIELFLANEGYFYSTVEDTLVYPFFQRKKKRKAIVCYIVRPATPYTIRKVSWDIRDPNIAYDLQTDTAASVCLLKSGARYDLDNFEDERNRITRSLRNNGYFKFSKDYIRYSIDTAVGNHQVNVRIIINRQQVKTSDTTWTEVDHQRFYIRNVIVKTIPSLQQLKDSTLRYDTAEVYMEMSFLRLLDSVDGLPRESRLRFKAEVLGSRIMFRPRILYSQSHYEETYRQLTSLRVFRQVVIEPIPDGDKLDIIVKLIPIPKQSSMQQLEGTNTGGNLGIGGSIIYQNHNLFRGAELLELRLKGGTEAQQPIGSTQSQANGGQLAFNTIEAGAIGSLNFPREFWPFNYLVVKNRPEEERRTKERRTVFTSSFNYQRRIDYDRSIGNLSYGYTFGYRSRREMASWKDNPYIFNRFGIYPIELNVVKVNPREGLENLLQNGDPLLQYRFTDHLIHDFRVTFTRNTQLPNVSQRRVFYLKVDFETAGFVLRSLFQASGKTPDAQGSYRIAGIPFAQYLRLFVDIHQHNRLGDHQVLAQRVAIGIGYPYGNFPSLPLEKSFYGGGANGIRAWEARSLGPGSYVVPADQKYSQFGDIQLEYNIELRFRITRTISGAVFADGGNIWLLRKDEQREGAEFDFGKFYNDLAFGPGVGLRYDLSFFIIRLDWAFKVRDPALPYGERWYVGQRKLGSNLNFGIGYPF